MKSKKKGDANKMSKAGAESGGKRLKRFLITSGIVVILIIIVVVVHEENNDCLKTLVEENRLRPYAERIFSKNTKFGIEFKLCKKGKTSWASFANLSQAMNICKEETENMTESEMLDSYDELYHNYNLYIYDPDHQLVETDDDKLRIIKRLRKMIEYLPDGRLDVMSFEYFVKKDIFRGSGGFWVRASDLSSSRNIPKLVQGFSEGMVMNTFTHVPDWWDYYPIRKGWDK